MTTLLEEPPQTDRPPTARTDGPRVFRPDVEGLRAVAVALVVLYHAGLSWIPGGYVGVDVFFVISGFLITGLLLREFDADGRIALVDFYARRARRILPLASVVLVVTVGASSIFLSSTRLASTARDGLWSAVFGANFRFSSTGANYLNATAAPSPLQHFWSLAVEEQFYVVWPALLWLALHLARRGPGRRARTAAITGSAVAASLVWSVVQTSSDANSAYFSPLTRGWELGAGAIVAILAVGLARVPRPAAAVLGWSGLALIAYAAVRFDAQTPFPGSAALVPVIGAVCVLVGGLRLVPGGPEAVLGTQPMQRIGKYSFSLYLWHWPILILAEARYPNIGLPTKLVLVLVALGLSALTYHRLENPVRRLPRLTRSPRASLLVGAVAVSASLVYSNMYVVGNDYVVKSAEQQFALQQSALATTGVVATTGEVITAVADAVKLVNVPADVTPPVTLATKDVSPAYADGCLVPAQKTVSPPCTFGDPTASKTVVLFGDSHAAQWMPALQNVATRTKLRLVVLTKGNCPAPTMTVYNVTYKRAFTECDQWRNWAMTEMAKIHPAVVVIASNFHGVRLPGSAVQSDAVETAWDNGLTKTFDRLKPAAGKVIMVGDVANHADVVADCVAANPHNLTACTTPVQHGTLIDHQARETAVATTDGVTYVDARPWFCTSTECPSVINGIITDFDDSHMTATYSKYLGHAFGVALGLEP